jgi:hypothetical protein
MTPSARSTKYLRDHGFIVCRVEQRLHMPKSPFPITKDAFGFGDLLAAKPGHLSQYTLTLHGAQIALVQVTSTGNLRARQSKIEAEPLADKWKQSGGTILLHGWAKRGSRGKRKRWTLKEEIL